MTLERRRRPGAASEATEAPFESFEPTQPALEYVTIRRDRDRTPIPPSPSDTPLSPSSPLEEPQQTRVAQDPTTPRYRPLVFQAVGSFRGRAFPSGRGVAWAGADGGTRLAFVPLSSGAASASGLGPLTRSSRPFLFIFFLFFLCAAFASVASIFSFFFQVPLFLFLIPIFFLYVV